MKILIKIATLLVCFSMIFSINFVQVKAYEPRTTCETNMIELINALGIASYTKDDYDKPVTRGEFYKTLCKLGGYPSMENSGYVFSDLSADSELHKYISTLVKAEILVPDKNGKIYSDSSIGATEAVAFIMKLLGYGEMAEAKGAYPTGYIIAAKTAGVSEFVDMSDDSITHSELAIMLYNALHADMMICSSHLDKGKQEYKISKDTNLLNSVFGVGIIHGVVEGVDVSRIAGKNDVLPFHIEVNGIQLESRNIENPHSYLGYEVEAYYKEDRLFGKKAIYLSLTSSNDITALAIEDIVSVSSGKVKAYVDGGKNVKTYKYKNGVPVIYNGISTGQNFENIDLNNFYGEVVLLDRTGDKVADIVFINVYQNYVVSYYDASEKMIYHKYAQSNGNPIKIPVDNMVDEPYVYIFDETGKEINPGEINLNSVASVYESAPDAPQHYIKVYIKEETVSGIIEEKYTNGTDNYIVVDGISYVIGDVCLSNTKNIFEVGAYVMLRMDYNGNVADVELCNEETLQYGFLSVAAVKPGLDSSIGFKIYTIDNTFCQYEVAERIRVDGVLYKANDERMLLNIYKSSSYLNALSDVAYGFTEAEALNLYKESNFPTSCVVRYALNAEGKISIIDTVMADYYTLNSRENKVSAINSLYYIKSASTDYVRKNGTYQWTVGPNVVMNSQTGIFMYPSYDNIFDEDEYNFGYASDYLIHDERYEVWAFYNNQTDYYAPFMAMSSDSNRMYEVGERNVFGVVRNVSSVMDPHNGEIVDCLTVFVSGSEVKLYVKDGLTVEGSASYSENGELSNIHKLQMGDIVRYHVDAKGYARNITVYYRPSVGEFSSASRGTVFRHTNALRKGKIYKSFAEGWLVYFGDKEISDVTSAECEFVILKGATPAYYLVESVDAKTVFVKQGSAERLKSYANAGNDCSEIIIQQYYGTPVAIAEIIISE